MQHPFPDDGLRRAGAIETSANPFGPVEIRLLVVADAPALREHLQRLEPACRRLRFGAPVNDIFIRNYAVKAFQGAGIVGIFVAGVLRGVAELRFDPRDTGQAEGAFSLEKPYRRLGFGSRLFSSLLESARMAGVQRLLLHCLRENVAMQRIARAHAAELSFEDGETIAEIRPHAPRPVLSAAA
ncbi:GNAT family N-acetyltransferase [Aureimonas populi]|uniref:GNAT family N-acetyltransferase n=1 Tax=Aureimonas populi TaxID=1701758 RepID=A0ABW5CN74_9HYPH|nr:GNAT family N-acetyltransferase [Aureimonas populi]